MASASCSTGAHATLEREPKMDTAELDTKCAGHQGLILWLQAVRKLHCSLLQIRLCISWIPPLGQQARPFWAYTGSFEEASTAMTAVYMTRAVLRLCTPTTQACILRCLPLRAACGFGLQTPVYSQGATLHMG